MAEIVMIALDPPYRLADEQFIFKLIGWMEVDDEDAPDVALSVNGRPAEFRITQRDDVRAHFPEMRSRGLFAILDFRQLLPGVDLQQDRGGFLLEVTVRSDRRLRTYEYAVSEAWLEGVFGQRLRARPVPPPHLQNRVAGANGEFCATGLAVARRVEAVLEEGGFHWPDDAAVLDFGVGPGRVITALQPRHPKVRFHGSDLDAEAIAWDQASLAHVGQFAVNGHYPPLAFPDATFDAIYTISIFTHLPEDHQFAWLSELRRVLKPGGLLLATAMNPNSPYLSEEIRRSAEATGFAYWGDAPATDGLPDFYRLAYHSHDYVRRMWTRGFEVLRLGDHDINGLQDANLLRRVDP